MHLHAFCFVLTRLLVYISIALNYFQNKILFSEKLQDWGDFQAKCVQGEILQKRLKTIGLGCSHFEPLLANVYTGKILNFLGSFSVLGTQNTSRSRAILDSSDSVHRDGVRRGRGCSHYTWSLDDRWVASRWV